LDKLFEKEDSDKKPNDRRSLSRAMQEKEASIFITALERINDWGIKSASKHDAILINTNNSDTIETAENIIKKVMDDADFKMCLKTTDLKSGEIVKHQ